MSTTKKVMILSGEASGDLYGAHLVEAMRAQDPSLTFFGMGGPKMRAAGVDIHVDAATVSVVGITEVFSQFRTILNAARTLKQALLQIRPDLLILIDFPDFNFHIAKFAKKHGIKIFYYISPQVWAWRKGRIKTIKKIVDLMMVILPFEVDFYQQANVPVHFEGHPLIDVVPEPANTESNPTPVVALLPGSRRSEIHRLMPVIVETAEKLKALYPSIQFILPLAPTLNETILQPYLTGHDLPLRIISGKMYQTVAHCDAAVVASGTATLETALLAVPMVIIYRVKKFSFYLGKLLINVPHIGLCNLIARERIVPELIQEEANSTAIANEVKKILDNPTYRQQIQHKLKQIRAQLGHSGVTQRIARAALQLIT